MTTPRLQQIIDRSLSLIYVKNRYAEYALANEISEPLIGFKKGEMPGKTDYGLFPNRDNGARFIIRFRCNNQN